MAITKVPNDPVENIADTSGSSLEQQIHNLCTAEFGMQAANVERTLGDKNSSLEQKISTLEFLGITAEKVGVTADIFKEGIQQLTSDSVKMLAFLQQFSDKKTGDMSCSS